MAAVDDSTTSFQDSSVRIGPLTNLPDTIRSFGHDPVPILAGAGFVPEQFSDPNTRVPYVAAGRLLARSATATGCRHLGLMLGEQAAPSHLGIAGFLARSAPDIGTALRSLVDYLDLHDEGGVPLLITTGDTTLLGYSILLPTVEAADHISDLSITIACKIMRALCGSGWNPTRVFLSRPQPLYQAPYSNFFRASIRFNAERNALMFPTRWLSQKVPSSDPLLYRHLQHEARDLKAGMDLRDGNSINLVGRIHRLIYECLALGKISVSHIAGQLCMERRTLNRRLKAEGTTFRQELERIRYSLSRQLLSETTVPIIRIAVLLGYAEASVFCRAFRQWSGTSPAKWRKRNFRQ